MQEFIKALSWTFVHSLWQGLLAAVIAAIILSLTRKTSARLRYNSLVLVMVIFFIGSIFTFIFQWNSFSQAGLHDTLREGDGITVMTGHAVFMDKFILWVNTNANYLMLAWTSCFLFSSLRLATGLAGVNRLRTYKTKPVSTEWKKKLEELQQLVGLRRTVCLLQSDLVKLPIAFGNLKPVILLPLGLLSNLPVEQVETILLHELAHIRRRDYLANLFQHAIEAIYFFNPALRWLSSLIREEREACCDDMVMSRCNQKTNYFNALVSFQEFSTKQPSYAMGISSKKQYLLNRVKRMITNRNKGTSLVEKIALAGGLILFSAFGFAAREKAIFPKRPILAHQEILTEQSIVNKTRPPLTWNEFSTIYNKARPDTFPHKKPAGKKPIKNLKRKPVKIDQKVIADKSVQPLKISKPEIKRDSKMEADAALQEIIKIKNEIGGRKEVIGVKKKQLSANEGRNKDKIQEEINKERRDLETKRDELERLRDKWDGLKKQAENEKVRNKKPPVLKSESIIKLNDNKFNLKAGNHLVEKQELQYKMKPDVKSPPASLNVKPIPVKLKSQEPPRKKVSLVP